VVVHEQLLGLRFLGGEVLALGSQKGLRLEWVLAGRHY
jgi:hypothetical protein